MAQPHSLDLEFWFVDASIPGPLRGPSFLCCPGSQEHDSIEAVHVVIASYEGLISFIFLVSPELATSRYQTANKITGQALYLSLILVGRCPTTRKIRIWNLGNRFYCCSMFRLLPHTGDIPCNSVLKVEGSRGEDGKEEMQWKGSRTWIPSGLRLRSTSIIGAQGGCPKPGSFHLSGMDLESTDLCVREAACHRRLGSCILIGLLKWLSIPSHQLQQSPFLNRLLPVEEACCHGNPAFQCWENSP